MVVMVSPVEAEVGGWLTGSRPAWTIAWTLPQKKANKQKTKQQQWNRPSSNDWGAWDAAQMLARLSTLYQIWSAQNWPWWTFAIPSLGSRTPEEHTFKSFLSYSDFRILLDCTSPDSKPSQTNPSESKYQSISEKCWIFIMSYSILNICQDLIFQKFIICVCATHTEARG